LFEFKLPDLGEGIAEGEILKWYVTVGGAVVEDEPLVDIETDKAAVTIPSPKGGTVSALQGSVGDIVNVGDVIIVIDDGSAKESAKEPAKTAATTAPAAATTQPTVRVSAPTPAPVVSSRKRPVPAAPATRRLARELKIDINLVTPSGPGGRVLPADLRRSSSSASGPDAGTADPKVAATPASDSAFAEFAQRAARAIPFLDLEPLPDFSAEGPVEIESLRSIRRKVAHKMVTSTTLVPHVVHSDEADVTALDQFRREERQRRPDGPGSHLTLLAFVLKAVTAGLKNRPMFNASLDPFRGEIVYKRYYNLGFAADTPRGLVVPVIKGTDGKSIIALADEIFDKATLAREGKLPAADMRGGTFTVTNVGSLGGTPLLPTINYPEVAILAMGQVREKPVVRQGQVVIRTVLPLVLAFDHRLVDGADAARFVADLVRRLSDPNQLLLEA